MQEKTITQVTDSLNEISQVVKQNSEASEKASEASIDLRNQAKILQDLVYTFKLQ